MSVDELRTELWKLTGVRPDGRLGAARLQAQLREAEARLGPAGPASAARQ
eukprot:SAG22_NODE_9386_length_592_cov_1.152130_1_plen_50_part_00